MRVVSSDSLANGRFEGAQYGPTNISMILDDEPPGGGPRLHRHPYDETWVVLEGDLVFEGHEGDPLPDLRGYSGIIAIGGPMGAYEEDRLPWLVAEKKLIAQAVRAGTPYWSCPTAPWRWPTRTPTRSRRSRFTTPTRCSSISRSTPRWPPAAAAVAT